MNDQINSKKVSELNRHVGSIRTRQNELQTIVNLNKTESEMNIKDTILAKKPDLPAEDVVVRSLRLQLNRQQTTTKLFIVDEKIEIDAATFGEYVAKSS
jgi:hypothetical protein